MGLTNSNISHAYVRLGEKVFQASGLRVNEEFYEDFLTYETVIKEVPFQMTDEQFLKAEEFRIAQLGKPYSIGEVFGFLWVLVMRRFGLNVANPLRDGNKAYVCSKLVACYLGIDDASESLSPVDLLAIVEKIAANHS
jgi:hypothetical protein